MLKGRLNGEGIRAYLYRRNLSQNWLAKRLGISSGYMTQLLNGTRAPSPRLRNRIQEHFADMEFDELFDTVR